MTRAAERITTAQTAAIVHDPAPAKRRIGESELRVFPLALSAKRFGWTADAATAERILDEYVACGGDLVDTADAYAGGRSEIILGNWMRSRRARDRVVVATKIGTSPDHPGLSAPAVAGAVEASLRRLRTDRIDLLFLHIDDPEVPFEETLLAVDELIRAGKVRYFGAARHTGDRLIEARVASAQLGVAPMVALQNQYSLVARREYEEGLAEAAAQLRLGVMPRFALAGGFLGGRFRSKADLAGGEGPDVRRHLGRAGLRVLQAIDAVAAEHDATPATIAIAWLLSKPLVVAPVVSVSTPEHVFDLVAAPGIRFTRQQLASLDRASA